MYKEFLSREQKHVLCLKQIVSHIKDNLMPHRSVQNILKHIYQCKHPRVATNPIQQYMLYGKLKPLVHYVYPLNQLVPPCKRLPEELPTQWKDYIYPYATRTQMVRKICLFFYQNYFHHISLHHLQPSFVQSGVFALQLALNSLTSHFQSLCL